MMWTKEFPTKKGWYWFYGWTFTRTPTPDYKEAELLAVRVWETKNGPVWVGPGYFMYQSETKGVWCPMDPPPIEAAETLLGLRESEEETSDNGVG
jgi:hypothetical protein